MKLIKHYIVYSILSLLALTGCDVHEFPEEREKLVSYMLHLDFDTEIPLYKEIAYSRNSESKGLADTHDIRYIVNAYRSDENGRSDSRMATSTFVLTRPYTSGLNCSVPLELNEGHYTFRVWTDYVDAGSSSDKYYDTRNFAEIILTDRENHPGSNDCREAFRGITTAEVTDNAGQSPMTVEMKRPMGKFKFVSTDVDAFYSRVVKEIMEKRGLSLEDESESDSRTIYDQLLKSVDITDYKVVFRYNIFMPCAFNMFTDKPADSWTGMSFNSQMHKENESEMNLGFDYIFVNGSETTLSISVEIYNADGELISSSNPVDVPIVRNKLTVVKGAFLTSKASGGVAINPGFDGPDYNIEIK